MGQAEGVQTDAEFLAEEEERLERGLRVDADQATASRLNRFIEMVRRYRPIVEELAKEGPPLSIDQETGEDCAFCHYDPYYDPAVNAADPRGPAFARACKEAMERPEGHEAECLWRRAVEATR